MQRNTRDGREELGDDIEGGTGRPLYGWLHWATTHPVDSSQMEDGRPPSQSGQSRPEGAALSLVFLVESGVMCRSNVRAPITKLEGASVCCHKQP